MDRFRKKTGFGIGFRNLNNTLHLHVTDHSAYTIMLHACHIFSVEICNVVLISSIMYAGLCVLAQTQFCFVLITS